MLIKVLRCKWNSCCLHWWVVLILSWTNIANFNTVPGSEHFVTLTVPSNLYITNDFCADWHLILIFFFNCRFSRNFWQGVHKLYFLEQCARWLVQGLAWMSARKWHLKIWGNASCYPRSVLRWWFCGAPSKKRFRNLSPIAKHISLLVSNALFVVDIYLLGSIANVALI